MRIAFIANSPPEPSYGGSLVIYNHFIRMKHHEILVVCSVDNKLDTLENQHWNVSFVNSQFKFPNWPFTKPIYSEICLRMIARNASKLIDDFAPDAIVTVWGGDFVFAAHKISQEKDIPLLVICHDDMESCFPKIPNVNKWARQKLKAVYKQAAKRLCVSEGMVECFQKRYGVKGTVLYPIGSVREAITPNVENNILESDKLETKNVLRVGYAGQIYNGYVSIFLVIADILKQLGGELHIASPTQASFRRTLTQHLAIVDRGYFDTPQQARQYFCQNVDAMLVVQSFNPEDRVFMETNFPSKLVEYSVYGLPVFIVAPPTGSASVWAKQYPDAAILVESSDSDKLAEAINYLLNSDNRQQLAKNLLNVSNQIFDPKQLHQVLEQALIRAVS